MDPKLKARLRRVVDGQDLEPENDDAELRELERRGYLEVITGTHPTAAGADPNAPVEVHLTPKGRAEQAAP